MQVGYDQFHFKQLVVCYWISFVTPIHTLFNSSPLILPSESKFSNNIKEKSCGDESRRSFMIPLIAQTNTQISSAAFTHMSPALRTHTPGHDRCHVLCSAPVNRAD